MAEVQVNYAHIVPQIKLLNDILGHSTFLLLPF